MLTKTDAIALLNAVGQCYSEGLATETMFDAGRKLIADFGIREGEPGLECIWVEHLFPKEGTTQDRRASGTTKKQFDDTWTLEDAMASLSLRSKRATSLRGWVLGSRW